MVPVLTHSVSQLLHCLFSLPPSHFPAAAVTGYQQPSEAAVGHGSQFYISLLDPSNKEQRLDEKGAYLLLKELIP